jgi:DNA segregation ATPase FtsK/SpoIIIE, S-DNA-T family
MSTTVVKRPARIAPPTVAASEVVIAEPPTPQAVPPAVGSLAMVIMPVVGGGGSLLFAVTNPQRPLFAAAGLVFLVASVAVGGVMLYGMRSGPRRTLREKRERYLDYLEDLRHRLRATVTTQQAAGQWRHPEPARLLDVARLAARRWERRPSDDDFLVLRAGVGDQPIRTTITMAAAEGPLSEVDPVCMEAGRQLRDRYRRLRDQPVCVDLSRFGVLSVVGDREAGRALARALLAQTVAFHSPHEVRLGVVRDARHAQEWDWSKWLPHTEHPADLDGELPARLIATSVPAMAELLAGEMEARVAAYQRRRGQPATIREHVVVVVDGEHLTSVWGLEPPERSIPLVDLGIHLVLLLGHRREEPEVVDARITVAADRTAHQEWSGDDLRVDEVPDGLLTSLARQCAPLRVLSDEDGDAIAGTVGLPEILGVPDVAELDPARTWRPRVEREFLRVPVGVGTSGTAVMLDLKEPAKSGMGPHGLVVGATGSGKSEMLRTLVTSLVIAHPPERLALMLVDFKGGTTFAPMRGLPHVAGMLTNLEGDLTLVDRMREALGGELRRRQEMLAAAGELANIYEYQAVEADRGLDPLPHLLVIIDEFSELLTAKPEMAELFVGIGRIGRALGVHLLLATQKLDMGRIRGLESHLSYRIALRTFTEAESREAIGALDAYHLPPEPGAGILKVDTTVFERFRAAMVSGRYTSPGAAPKTIVPVVPFTALSTVYEVAEPVAPAPEARAGERTVLDIAVERIRAAGRPVTRPVWLSPLPEALPLDRVLDLAGGGPATAVLGLVDDPAAQRQAALEWDFTGAGGNLLVAGAPQSGKSTLLRTLICSMALRYPPGEVAFYGIDYGGGSLAALQDLPHVAAIATRAEPERTVRTIAEVGNALAAREELFRTRGLDSPAALRRARAAGTVPRDVPGDVLLVIDGWGGFREENEVLEQRIAEIAGRGLTYGVHVVLTVTQTAQVRMRMQPAFGGRVELRLNDAFDSAIDRKAQQALDVKRPGRGLVAGGLLFHTALPRIDGQASTSDLTTAQKRLVADAAERWPGMAVPPVRVLPERVAYDSLPPAGPARRGVPVGLAERDLLPAAVDLESRDPHLLVYGDGQTGKTNLLRVLLRGYQQRYTPERLGIVVVDYRHGLQGVVPKEYLLAQCTTQQKTLAVAREVADSIARRLPGPDLPIERLRARDWWNGLEVLVVVDDYDLVSAASGNPLLALVEYLPQARDLGLHLVVARRTGGASRAVLDPVIQRLNDLSTPGFLFSGDRMEGRLVNGVAAQQLPVGRALYATRGGGSQRIQVAYLPEPTESPVDSSAGTAGPEHDGGVHDGRR